MLRCIVSLYEAFYPLRQEESATERVEEKGEERKEGDSPSGGGVSQKQEHSSVV